MSLRAGDTVTSTKSLTKSTTTNLTTTGEHKNGRAAPRPDTKAATRKRRQQQPQETVVPAPPPKSRRRGETPGGSGAGANRSRLGDFFSTLASRIRGNKAPEASLAIDRGNSENRQTDDKEAMVGTTGKKKQRHELEEGINLDSNKKRKLEHDKSADAPREELPGVKDELGAESLEAPEATDLKNERPTAAAESDRSPEEEGEAEIIGVCRNIVADMCKKIENADRFESRASISTVVLSTDADYAEPPTRTESLVSCTGERKYAASSRAPIGSVSRQSLVLRKSAPNGDDEKDEAAAAGQEGASGRLNPKLSTKSRKDEAERHRRTIQWLEEGARRLREDLASVRSELHEERKASKLLRRELETAVREARSAEALKFTGIVSDLKARLSQSPSRSTIDSLPSQSKTDLLREENHRREITALKNRLAEAETMVQKLKTDFLGQTRGRKKNKDDGKVGRAEMRKLEVEIQTLRAVNKKLEEKLQIAEECGRARAAELRQEHERHEAEMAALQKALRSGTIKMMDEIQSKGREIEKLEKLVSQSAQLNEKLRSKEDEKMRKLRESDRSHQTRLTTPRLEEKIHRDDDAHEVDQCKVACEEDEVGVTELDRLRELAIEQQEVIEVLRQAVKEKDRKLDCMTRKQHKESFYKQYINLEPVVEVDDESEDYQNYEEGDSALSSAPPSLSPQPGSGGCRGGCVGPNGVTREVYESLLLEVEELQTKLLEEQSELSHARSQVRDLEKALLQETRGSQTNRLALHEKLRLAGEREASLVAEISELREQNELLEFRVLELEELPNPRDTPDPADSGIVSPEPIHLYKEPQPNKHRDRAVATVIPYTSAPYSHPALPATDAQKSPLSLQESGIFEDEEAEYEHQLDVSIVEPTPSPASSCSSQSTQTDAPAGELLQEVQRLQELRVRIQERAAKIPLPPLPLVPTVLGDRSSECSVEVAPLREKIGELEARVADHEAERRVSKQREEELLDENYRLAERVYCLEAELNELEAKLGRVGLTCSDAEVMTEEIEVAAKRDAAQQYEAPVDDTPAAEEEEEEEEEVYHSPTLSKCHNLYRAALVRVDELKECDAGDETSCPTKARSCAECGDLWRDCDERIQQLARTEICLRQQIASLELRESALFKTLRHADENWTRLEAEYEAKHRDVSEQLSAQKELNRSLFEQFGRLDRSPAAAGDSSSSVACTQTEEEGAGSCSAQCRGTPAIGKSAGGTTTISLNGVEGLGCAGGDLYEPKLAIAEPAAEVATEAKEEDASAAAPASQQKQQDSCSRGPNALVDAADNPSGEKKQIIYFRWR